MSKCFVVTIHHTHTQTTMSEEEFHDSLVSRSLKEAGAKWWFARAFNSIFVCNLVVVWSIIMYTFVFHMFIPSPMQFSTDLYFDYGNNNNNRPLAQVNFDPTPRPFFHAKEDYRISIDLVVPQSESNQNLGVFMIESTLTRRNNNNNASIQSKRPCSLPHHARASRVFADLVLAPMRLLTNWSPPEDTVSIALFDKYTALPREQASHHMNIELSTNAVNIKQAKLHVVVLLTGFRYYMFHWFWTCALLSITLLAVLHLVLAIIFVASEAQQQEEQQHDSDSDK